LRTTKFFLLYGWLLVGGTLQGRADEQTVLASCSLRYGYSMADHWLTVDVAEEIERALFYSRVT